MPTPIPAHLPASSLLRWLQVMAPEEEVSMIADAEI